MSVIHDALEKGGSLRSLPKAVSADRRLPLAADPLRFLRCEPAQKWLEKHRQTVFLALFLALPALWLGWFASGRIPPAETPALSVASAAPSASVPLPVQAKPAAQTRFVLNGIIAGRENQAIINDEIVSAGDRILNAQVKEIKAKHVILESRGKEILLHL